MRVCGGSASPRLRLALCIELRFGDGWVWSAGAREVELDGVSRRNCVVGRL